MIQVEQLYCCSLKKASMIFAGIIIALKFLSLIFIIIDKAKVMDYSNFTDSDGGFYSAVAVIIMQILAALSCYYGVVKTKPDFMIPIIVLIPVSLVMELIFLVIWYSWYSFSSFIINALLLTYVWVCFYTYWQQLRK